jgi:A/G-specific adenine glycosylase
MPWRRDTSPFYVLVSELLLQQTQVDRVIPKFESFVRRFPDVSTLASAPLADVLVLWQGLGYNRRAKYLHDAAKHVVLQWGGTFPPEAEKLAELPGVGKNTAGAIAAYAFNQPALFIETNIRTVLIHHFFDPLDMVSDAELWPILSESLGREEPRQFYWAMMDYGSWLKRQGVKNVGQSRHYTKQSRLKGSVRQTRGAILKALTKRSESPAQLEQMIGLDERFDPALSGLIRDGLVEYVSGELRLAGGPAAENEEP